VSLVKKKSFSEFVSLFSNCSVPSFHRLNSNKYFALYAWCVFEFSWHVTFSAIIHDESYFMYRVFTMTGNNNALTERQTVFNSPSRLTVTIKRGIKNEFRLIFSINRTTVASVDIFNIIYNIMQQRCMFPKWRELSFYHRAFRLPSPERYVCRRVKRVFISTGTIPIQARNIYFIILCSL